MTNKPRRSEATITNKKVLLSKDKCTNEVELLAPAGDMEKLKIALHFGADAVYFAGKKFGLRAFSKNFESIAEPIEYAHSLGKKAYVTVNIYARNYDITELKTYLKEIESAGADGVIVSDLGVMSLVNEYAPKLELHISTQANTTNYLSALAYVKKFNAKRIVLARELTFEEVKKIATELKKEGAEVEVFIHGAMCISYSGRCLLSNYLTNRDSNRGACVQACRFAYNLIEADAENNIYSAMRQNEKYPIFEDENGTYILNSKDMCLIEYMDELIKSGVKSFKIEGRMKSPYYLATVVNAYRRKIDEVYSKKKDATIQNYIAETEKSSHRQFTTGFMVDDGAIKQNTHTTHQTQTEEFLGIIIDKRVDNRGETELKIEMRNRFMLGSEVEILSPTDASNKRVKIKQMTDDNGQTVTDAKNVQERLWVKFDCDDSITRKILPLDIIRGERQTK